MRVLGYTYPWDVLDAPDFTDRATALGVDEVAVALAYHSARAATPWSPRGSSVLARHAALYRPIRPEQWQGAQLRPYAPDWIPGPDSGGEAVRLLRAAGLPVAGWLVLTHNSRLGAAFPTVAVRNCFGEVYPWALCPAQPAVRDYAARLTAEAVRGLDLESVILEACGPLGVVHQHQHEKTDGVWSPLAVRLLSVCCCPACAAGWTAAGHRAADIVALLRRAAREAIGGTCPAADADVLPGGIGELLLATRQSATDALRRAVVARIPERTRVVLHGSFDPWATGALPGLTPAAPADVDSVVLPNWVPGQAGYQQVAAVRAALPDRVAVGSYVTAVAAAPVPDMGAYVTGLARAGATELHLYHLGLAGPGRQADLRAAVAAARG